MKHFLLLITSTLFALITISLHSFSQNLTPDSTGTIYVKVDGTGNGSSWENATSDLQGAIDVYGVTQVWVSKGTYYATKLLPTNEVNFRMRAFQMKGGVNVYGNFNGNETSIDERSRIDTSMVGAENSVLTTNSISYHIVVSDTREHPYGAILDGFEIRGGKADYIVNPPHNFGGGIVLTKRTKVQNCYIHSNQAEIGAGAVLYQGGTIDSCYFMNNSASHEGGAIVVIEGGTIENSYIFNNTTSGRGAGIYMEDGGSGVIKNCKIIGNRADNYGGGVYFRNVESANIQGSYIANNIASISGGGIYVYNSSADIYSCTVVNNEATSGYGGGINSYNNASANIVNSVFIGNTASTGNNMHQCNAGCTLNVSYSGIEGGYEGENNVSISSNDFVDSDYDDLYDGVDEVSAPSKCLNSGDNSIVDASDLDLNGNTRIAFGIVDMGAFESITCITYQLTSSVSSEGGSISPASVTLAHGSSQIFTLAIDEGYELDEATFSGSGTVVNNTDGTLTLGGVTSAGQLSVAFKLKQYEITTSTSIGGGISPASVTLAHGSSQTFTLAIDEGYELDEATFSGSGTVTNNEDGTLTLGGVTSAGQLSVAFKLKQYEITTSTSAGGSISPASVTLAHGSSQTFTLTIDEGYELDEATFSGGGTVTDNEDGTLTLGGVTSAGHLSVAFKLKQYEITTSTSIGGGISPASVTLAHGSSQIFTLATDEGYELDEATFSGSGTVVNNTDGTLTLGGVTSAGQLSVAFKLKQYEITTSTSAGGGISPASVTLAHGSSQIFTLAIDEGYELDEATFSGGGTVTDNEDGTLTLGGVTSAGHLSVAFKLKQYEITTSTSIGGGISPASVTLAHGSSQIFTLAIDEGYELDEATFSGSGTVTDNEDGTLTLGGVTSAGQLSVAFKLKQYEITTSTSIGGGISPASVTLAHGSSQTFTLAIDEGYELDEATFSGSGTVTNNEDGTLTLGGVTSAGQLSVAFKLKQYEITTSTSAGGSISPASVTLAHGSSQTFTLTIDEGYELDEATFSGGGTVTDNEDGTLTLGGVTSAGHLSVAFKLKQYEITTSTSIGGGISPASVTLAHGSSQIFTLATDEGYELDEATFSGSGTVVNNTDGTLTLGGVTSAGQLSVAFKLKQHEITTSTSAGGGISPASVTLAHGSSQIFTLAIDEGYELDEATFSGGGTVTDNEDGTLTLGGVTSAGHLSVAFKLKQYEITTSTSIGGGISPASVTLAHGSSQIFTLAIDEGYELDEATFSGSGTVTDNEDGTLTLGGVTSAGQLSVAFKLKQYEITTSTSAGGGISPASVTLAHGSSQIFTLAIDEGYELDEATFSGGGTVTDNEDGTLTLGGVTSAGHLSVAFKLKQYEITTSTSIGGGISPASVTLAHGSSQIFTLAIDEGYELDEATFSGSGTVTDNEDGTLTLGGVTSAGQLSVAFKLKQYEITTSTSIGGGISPASVTLAHGSSQIFTLATDEGYELDEATFSGSGTVTDNEDGTLTLGGVTSAGQLSVAFKLKQYEITTSTSIGGGISPASVTLAHGSSQIFTLAIDEGYELDEAIFSGGGTVVDNSDGTLTLAEVTSAGELSVEFIIVSGIQVTKNNAFTIYPNPTSGVIKTIGINSPYYHYTIHDLSGALMLRGNLSEEGNIDISKLKNGVYILTLKFLEIEESIKIIKN